MTASAAAEPPTRTLDLPASRRLPLGGRPLLMGVLNLTPDSFSDGGRFLDADRALEHALEMLEDGADLIDLGAESTRPGGGVYGEGAAHVDAATELDRLLPTLMRLRGLTEAPLSVDTRKADVARAALAEGADLINDVSALADPEMGPVVAESGVPIVLMHSRGELRNMQTDIRFTNVALEVRNELSSRVTLAEQQGIRSEQILVDPGIGFGKTMEQNLELLRRLELLAELGRPIVVAASRKSFIGAVSGAETPHRLGGSVATAAWAGLHGASIVRVHDVAETAQFLQLWSALQLPDEPPQ